MEKEILLSPRSVLKVLILGDHSTGKTSLLYKYMNLTNHVNITTGCEQHLHHLKIYEKKYCFNIYDISGHYSYHKFIQPIINNNYCDGIIFVFDLTSIHSFNNLEYWMELANQKSNNKFRILIGNKTDKVNKQVGIDKINEFCKINKMTYYETSIINNTSITNAFDFFFNNIVITNFCHGNLLDANIHIKNSDRPKRNCCFIDINF